MPLLRLNNRLVSLTRLPTRFRYSQRCRLSTTSKSSALDPSTNLADTIKPAKSPIPDANLPPSRPATEPSDGRNPFMQGYPSSTGQRTTSTASPDTTTFEDQSYMQNATAQMSNSMASRYQTNPPQRKASSIEQKRADSFKSSYESPRAAELAARTMEMYSSRFWQDGDVYAPHDLSWVEQEKARRARMVGSKNQLNTLNSRKHGTKDVLDELGLNPMKEYKNFAMLSEFVSETGRIRHSRETGLRAVDQRKMAKAVRRAVGIGILPSVHKHPELFNERRIQRGEMADFAKK